MISKLPMETVDEKKHTSGDDLGFHLGEESENRDTERGRGRIDRDGGNRERGKERRIREREREDVEKIEDFIKFEIRPSSALQLLQLKSLVRTSNTFAANSQRGGAISSSTAIS